VESYSRFLHLTTEGSALATELLAVLIITIAIAFGTLRFLVNAYHRHPDAYHFYRERLTKALLLGLTLLLAADIVRTVEIEMTLTNVVILGALVIVRTILSWSLILEMEGRWPWQVGAAAVKKES
jgi:uncharacterized membrane protein